MKCSRIPRPLLVGGTAIVLLVVNFLLAARVDAATAEVEQDSLSMSAAKSYAAAAVGVFLPSAHVASTEASRAWVTGVGGYDAARGTGTFEAATEVRIWGPFSARAGAVYANATGKLRPSVGGRVQALREETSGVAAAVGVFYRPEGLTESEGEIEAVASLGRHVGRYYILGNIVYGQDPEGNERDGEVRLAALRPVGSMVLMGVDGRLRLDLGSNAAKLEAHHEATMDGLLGPVVTCLLGSVAISLQGGGSTYRVQGSTSIGAFAMFGIGTAL